MDKRSTTRTITHTALKLTALLASVLASGCNVVLNTTVTEPQYYYVNPNKNLSAVGRAVLIEMNNDSTYPQISADMTDALFQAIQKKQIFSIHLLNQTDPALRSLQLHNDAELSLEQLGPIRKTLNCNAVLMGTVTTYQPYPHLSIGLRLKLVDLSDGQLLWGFEQIWDTTDKSTERRIKNYFEAQIRSGITPLHEQLVVVSSLKFVKFVAYEVAETM